MWERKQVRLHTDAFRQSAAKPSRFAMLCLGAAGVTVCCILLGYPGILATLNWQSPRGMAVTLLLAYLLFWAVYFLLSRATSRTKVARCWLTTAAFLLPLLLAESLVYFRVVDFGRLLQGRNHPVGRASLE